MTINEIKDKYRRSYIMGEMREVVGDLIDYLEELEARLPGSVLETKKEVSKDKKE